MKWLESSKHAALSVALVYCLHIPAKAQTVPPIQPAIALNLDTTVSAGQYSWAVGEPNRLASWEDGEPVRLSISLALQRLYVWRGEQLIGVASVSTGAKGYSTPRGEFTILQKATFHRSNIYSGAPMPYMQRLTWTGIALHAGENPGHPASHGCIRLPYTFARDLFRLTQLGAVVTISDTAEAPADLPPTARLPSAPKVEARPWLPIDSRVWGLTSRDGNVTGGGPHWLPQLWQR